MSSDDYFDSDSLHMNTAFLTEVDALEVAYTSGKTVMRPDATTSDPKPSTNDSDTINYDDFFNEMNSEDFEILDNPAPFASGVTELRAAGPAPLLRQRTLFGDIIEDPRPSNPNKSSTSPGAGAKKVKHWDYSMPFSSKRAKAKAKAKEEDGEDGEEDNRNLDLLCDSTRSPPSFKHKPDLLLAKHWIYPINIPKRAYQFNIVRESLFENSLVSLPTGLGKTFIAGVVMLNYYRWFPEGKVVFVAPTKPLVAQQIDACHKICGIPGSYSIELTGQTARKSPDLLKWREKRVFFMTPQTFMNDLKTETCNPTDVVLIVIDEAHRGTGDHSYAQIVRYLMIKNGHFRILALTATPGSNSEAVQKIIDALHISRIEIRDENSLDLRQYVLPKKITTHVIKMSEDIIRVRDLLAKIMKKVAGRIVDLGLMPNVDVMKLHPYRCKAVQDECKRSGMSKKFPFVFGILNQLSTLARAMGYLTECSLNMCYNDLQGLLEDGQQEVKKSKLASDPLFQDVIKELDRQHNKGFSTHPKVDKLVLLALEYFTNSNDEQESRGQTGNNTSRMMVFANYRMVVDEIVSALNQHQPFIRATRFVGQGTDKKGNKGILQREQLEIIQKFKEGEFNILVATSIGEEGLDIGEVDSIICYDAQKTPIRMLQRIGRTGRRRAGRVDVLLSEAREEANWEKARNDYERVQKIIIRGDSLQLFADVERLLPNHLKPVCQETVMPIEEYSRDTGEYGKGARSLPEKKRKACTVFTRNLPPGAIDSFIPSSELLAETSKKRRKLAENDVELSKPRKTSTTKSAATRHKKKTTATEPTLSQLEREIADDSDDKDLELGIDRFLKSNGQTLPKSPSVISLSSSNSDAAQEAGLPKEDHSWLLDSDLNDNATHVPNKPKRQPTRSLATKSSSLSPSSEPIRAPRRLQSRQQRVASEHGDSSPSQSNTLTVTAPNPVNPRYLDVEAEVSGECSSDESISEVERDSDRRFLQELSPSQKLTSYNQTMAYRQSLLTQMDTNSRVPKFNSRIIRKGPFGPARPLPRNINRSSSPDRSADRYSLDSFLVEDDDNILLTSRSSNF